MRNRKYPAGTKFDDVLLILVPYVILKASYNFTRVPSLHIGTWHLPLSFLVVSLLAALVLGRILPKSRPVWGAVTMTAAYSATVVVSFWATFNKLHAAEDNYGRFFRNRASIRAGLNSAVPDAKLVEIDDGIIAFTLPNSAMAGMGYALDFESFKAGRHGRLFDECLDRGYDVIAFYHYLYDQKIPNDSVEIRKTIAYVLRLVFPNQETSHLEFEVVYRHEPANATIIKIRRPKSPQAASQRVDLSPATLNDILIQ